MLSSQRRLLRLARSFQPRNATIATKLPSLQQQLLRVIGQSADRDHDHVDVLSRQYEFPFAPNIDWSRKFAPGPEIQAYLQRVASQRELRQYIRFNEEIIEARFAHGRWHMRTARGETDTADDDASQPECAPALDDGGIRVLGQADPAAEQDDRADHEQPVREDPLVETECSSAIERGGLRRPERERREEQKPGKDEGGAADSVE